jgi:hypothetical protein
VVRGPRSEWLVISANLGGEVIELSVSSGTSDAQILAALDEAADLGFRVLLHLRESTNTEKPWRLEGGQWVISARGAEILRVVDGHPALLAVYALHEPFDSSGYHADADAQRALYGLIKSHANVAVWTDIATLHGPVVDGELSDGICDYCCVFPTAWHRGLEEVFRRMDEDLAVQQADMPNSRLVFMLNVYQVDGSHYRLPSVDELTAARDRACELGVPMVYYPWQHGSYDLTLADVPDLWPVVAGGCGEGPPSPTDTPAPPPTDTPAPPPTDTPTPPPTDTPAPPPPTNTPGPSGGIVIDHRHVNAGELSPAELDAARQVAAYFNHASIGGNILDGMRDLQSRNATRYSINIQFSSGTAAGINEYQAGSNGRPITKIDGFASNVKAGHDAAFLKFCTGDVPCVNGDTPIETMWTRYRDMMAAQQSQHPDTALVWWTIPIIARDHSRAQCDQELGWFNDQVRQYVQDHGLMLFDLADIESHDPSGDPVTTSQGYEAAWPGYTSDGAHLNETGRQRVANAVWHLLAEIARE